MASSLIMSRSSSQMSAADIEFGELVNAFNRLIEKYTGQRKDGISKPNMATPTVAQAFSEDPQCLQMTSPFDIPWSAGSSVSAPVVGFGLDRSSLTSLCTQCKDSGVHCGPHSASRPVCQKVQSIDEMSGCTLHEALSRLTASLKHPHGINKTSLKQALTSDTNNVTFLKLASLDYAQLLARLSSSHGAASEQVLFDTQKVHSPSSTHEVNMLETISGTYEYEERQKRKNHGNEECPQKDSTLPCSYPVKRSRLVWTPELHQCFKKAVEKIGLNKAVPKAILEEMKVEGLTRENVASHLQKYRIQLKQDCANEDTQSLEDQRKQKVDIHGHQHLNQELKT